MMLDAICNKHPRYRGKRAPKAREESNPAATCYTCWFLYFAQRGIVVPAYQRGGNFLRFKRTA